MKHFNSLNTEHYKFLFIDDSRHDNFFTENIIELDVLPILVHFEPNPVKALCYLRQCTPETFPQVIVADINMPLMNGFQFVDAYKLELKKKYPDTLLFITSSSSRPSEISKVKNYPSVIDFLEKPFSKYNFEQHILPYLNSQPTSATK